jgi:hypothetical protein
MKNLKTFEEFKYLNIGDKGYSRTEYKNDRLVRSRKAERDKNEPFFITGKKKYKKEKQKEIDRQDMKRAQSNIILKHQGENDEAGG